MAEWKQIIRFLRLIGFLSILVCLCPAGCNNHQRQIKYDPDSITVHAYQIDGLTVRTGDLICCTNTADGVSIFGMLFWRLFGMIIPGEVDHIAIYVGPDGRCVEAGTKYCVTTFDIKGNTWNSSKMIEERGPILDNLYGIAYPLAGLSLSSEKEEGIRKRVAIYCLRQAEAKKLYNAVFLDSMTENAFYCSQLAYKAYLKKRDKFKYRQRCREFSRYGKYRLSSGNMELMRT